MNIDDTVAIKVFGFSEDIVNNQDLPPFDYSTNRNSALKVVEKVWLSDKVVRVKFNTFIKQKYELIKVKGGEDEFLLSITPDIICEAGVYAFT